MKKATHKLKKSKVKNTKILKLILSTSNLPYPLFEGDPILFWYVLLPNLETNIKNKCALSELMESFAPCLCILLLIVMCRVYVQMWSEWWTCRGNDKVAE